MKYYELITVSSKVSQSSQGGGIVTEVLSKGEPIYDGKRLWFSSEPGLSGLVAKGSMRPVFTDFVSNFLFCLVISERSRSVLSRFLDQSAELIPMDLGDMETASRQPYYLVRLQEPVDCISLKGVPHRFDRSIGELQLLNWNDRIRVRADRLKHVAISRIRKKESCVLFSESVVEAIASESLTGYVTRPVDTIIS